MIRILPLITVMTLGHAAGTQFYDNNSDATNDNNSDNNNANNN